MPNNYYWQFELCITRFIYHKSTYVQFEISPRITNFHVNFILFQTSISWEVRLHTKIASL